MKILVADDDRRVRTAVVTALELDGLETVEAESGHGALRSILEFAPDAVILDWLMPGPDGLEVCRMLRTAGDRIPILILTARSEVTDRVAGLDAGADDYLAKPFDLSELIARVHALLRRSQPNSPELLQFADLTLDIAAQSGSRQGRIIEFSRTEFSLLELFMSNPGQILTRAVILDRVWGTDFGPTSNSLAVYINYLRGKLENGGEQRIIQTVRGIGYRLATS